MDRSRVVLAGILIFLGLLFLLGNLGAFDFDAFRDVIWPTILILLGLWWLAGGGGFLAVAVIVTGGIFLAENLGLIAGGGFGRYWPVILIAGGVWVLLQRATSRTSFMQGRQRANDGQFSSTDTIDVNVVFGGAERLVTSDRFRGGRVSAVFGEVKVDLRRGRLANGRARLEASATFGGVEIIVPPEWEVRLQGSPILGGIEDKRRAPIPRPGAPVLEVEANATFGAVEIKDA